MKRIENCPVCERADIKTHVKMGEQQRSRYMEYSRIKYGGLLDGWIENLSLDVLVCSSCGHFLLSHQPDERALSAMYAAGRPLRGEKNEVS
jgi:rubrerythrin